MIKKLKKGFEGETLDLEFEIIQLKIKSMMKKYRLKSFG